MENFINISKSISGNDIYTVLFKDGTGKHVSQHFTQFNNAQAYLEHLTRNYSNKSYY